GSISQMTTELIASLAKVKFLSVPYRGEGPALTGTLGGEVDLMIATSTAALPHLKSGQLRGIGVTGRTRWKDFADIPTVAESGLADLVGLCWYGIHADAVYYV